MYSDDQKTMEYEYLGVLDVVYEANSFIKVKPLITNTSEEFIKCRLDNFSMSFILYYINFSIC